LDCLIRIARDEGPTKVFKGSFATAAREIPGNIGFFGAYWQLKRLWAKYVQGDIPVSDISFLGCLLSGGFAGVTAWSVCYP
jgi:hypothetical protein